MGRSDQSISEIFGAVKKYAQAAEKSAESSEPATDLPPEEPLLKMLKIKKKPSEGAAAPVVEAAESADAAKALLNLSGNGSDKEEAPNFEAYTKYSKSPPREQLHLLTRPPNQQTWRRLFSIYLETDQIIIRR